MKKGFTLSELLIALGVIGVVAVLTLPNVFGKTHSKANIAVLQSTYSQIADAVAEAIAEHRVRYWTDIEFDDPEGIGNQDSIFLNTYLNVTKDCGNKSEGCFTETYKDMNGNSYSDLDDEYNAFVTLKNGASVAFYSQATEGGHGIFLIDANGLKTPNVLGKDIFVIAMNSKGVINTMDYDTPDKALADCQQFKNYGLPCIYYLQQKNWNIDY